jgi:drug/metabolite transporter superfamily protein YnfA
MESGSNNQLEDFVMYCGSNGCDVSTLFDHWKALKNKANALLPLMKLLMDQQQILLFIVTDVQHSVKLIAAVGGITVPRWKAKKLA